jgi:hypothetical protein
MDSERNDLMRRLCPALADPHTIPRAALRAMGLCPSDLPGVADGALARLRSLLAMPAEEWNGVDQATRMFNHMLLS